MIQYVKQGGDFGRAFIQQLKERSANSGKKVDDAVAEIVETVRQMCIRDREEIESNRRAAEEYLHSMKTLD